MKNNPKGRFLRLIKKSPVEVFLIASLLFAVVYAALPAPVLARAAENQAYVEKALALTVHAMQNVNAESGTLPTNDLRGPAYSVNNIPVTAYNSVYWQTDATPCIGAQGTDICVLLAQGSDTCAANFVPLGTVLDVEGLGTCVVRDRMNARYHYRVDWYMGMDLQGARSWGVKYLDVGVYAS